MKSIATQTWKRLDKAALLLILAGAILAGCSGEGGSPQPTPASNPQEGNPIAEATSTTGTKGSGGAKLSGIDFSQAKPCDLLTKDEAEAVMGPLDWKPTPRAKICDFDDPVQGNTPEKSLAVRLIERDGWMDEFDHLQGPGTLLVPRQEVGLGSEVALRYNNDSVQYKLPALCDLELPCVIAHEAPIPKAGSVWMTLTAIMPDRSAIQILVYPQNVDYAKQLARTALERLPLK